MTDENQSERRKRRYEKKAADDRIAEWLMVRQTGTLADLIDEVEFAELCGVAVQRTRDWRNKGHVYGLTVPTPLFRPESRKPLWLRAEIDLFVRQYKGAKAIKRGWQGRPLNEKG